MDVIEVSDLAKGELVEEKLRSYFLDLGYYVVRSAKLKFQAVDITDVDLWLYHRTTPISRERINVDIKYKAKPAAVERIIVAKGIMDILGNDRCVVATSDKRIDVVSFGQRHNVQVLGGDFLYRIKNKVSERISEESLHLLLKSELSKFSINWAIKYEESKSRLIENLDFANANVLIQDIISLIEQIYSTTERKDLLIRILYALLSHLYITVDFVLRDMAFIDTNQKLANLDEGFRYGAVGQDKIKLRIDDISKEIKRSSAEVRRAAMSIRADILKDFFGKNEVAGNLFRRAKDFEMAAFAKILRYPNTLDPELKSAIAVICDFASIDRALVLGISS